MYESDVQPMRGGSGGTRYYPIYRKVGGRGWNYYLDGEAYLWFDSHQKAWEFTQTMDGPDPGAPKTIDEDSPQRAQQDTTHTVW